MKELFTAYLQAAIDYVKPHAVGFLIGFALGAWLL